MGFSKKDLGDVVWNSETGRDPVFLTSRPKDIDYAQFPRDPEPRLDSQIPHALMMRTRVPDRCQIFKCTPQSQLVHTVAARYGLANRRVSQA